MIFFANRMLVVMLAGSIATLTGACSLTLETDCADLCPPAHLCQGGKCVPILPRVTGINGNGPELAIVDDRGQLAGIGDRVDAVNRFRNAWYLTGERLEHVTGLVLDPEAGGTSSVYRDGGSGEICLLADATRCFHLLDDGETWELPLPLDLTEGPYSLRLSTISGEETSVQVMVLRGEKGPPGNAMLSCEAGTCTLDRNLVVSGGVDVDGTTQVVDLATSGGPLEVPTLSLEHIVVERKVESPQCPSGYTLEQGAGDIVVCARSVSGGQADQIVRVGDFWIDRYEASAWTTADCTGALGTSQDNYPATFPDDGQWTAPVYACSLTGVQPARHLTWFQAQQACAASGKQLCTSAQWQAAVAGTFDPSINPTQVQCNTSSMQARGTGQAGDIPGFVGACISNWGTEDQIGNLGEWVADWLVAGRPPVDDLDIYERNPWPASFGDDLTRNVVGVAATLDDPVGGLPAALVRGGDHMAGDLAGAFALDARWAPSHSDARVGLRCCLAR